MFLGCSNIIDQFTRVTHISSKVQLFCHIGNTSDEHSNTSDEHIYSNISDTCRKLQTLKSMCIPFDVYHFDDVMLHQIMSPPSTYISTAMHYWLREIYYLQRW